MEEEIRSARKKALQLLERMDRTESGLREKLAGSGFSPEAVQDALSYVKSFGYVDDERYAGNFVRMKGSMWGKNRIVNELYKRGISRDLACRAFEEACMEGEVNVEDTLLELIRRKCPNGPSDEKEKRRLFGFLARRGFSPGEIFKALQELEKERETFD